MGEWKQEYEAGFDETFEETATDLSIRKLRATISKINEHSIIKIIRLGKKMFEDINGSKEFTQRQLDGEDPKTFLSHEIAKSILLEENEFEIVVSDELPKKGIHLGTATDVRINTIGTKVRDLNVEPKPFTVSGTINLRNSGVQYREDKNDI